MIPQSSRESASHPTSRAPRSSFVRKMRSDVVVMMNIEPPKIKTPPTQIVRPLPSLRKPFEFRRLPPLNHSTMPSNIAVILAPGRSRLPTTWRLQHPWHAIIVSHVRNGWALAVVACWGKGPHLKGEMGAPASYRYPGCPRARHPGHPRWFGGARCGRAAGCGRRSRISG
jgi:hypothetical protein